MKKQLKTLAIASTVIMSVFTQSFANEGVSSKVELKSNTEVVNILNKKAKKLVKKNADNLNLYVTVMDLYSNAPATFYNLDETTKKSFFAASKNLNQSLSNSRKKEVKDLASQVEFNTAVSKFIWDVKDTAPVSIVENTSLTSL